MTDYCSAPLLLLKFLEAETMGTPKQMSQANVTDLQTNFNLAYVLLSILIFCL